MTLCDRCYQPGVCCTWFCLSVNPPEEHAESAYKVNAWIKDELPSIVGYDVPFVFAGVDSSGNLRYSCPKLSPNGRCSIYPDRPECCVIFEPGSDAICLHSDVCESGDGSADIHMTRSQP